WRIGTTEPVTPNTLGDTPAQVIIKGRLTDFANDYRAALNYLESFQRDLAAQGYQITVLANPLDVSPSGSIADQRDTHTDALGFSLKLSRRPPA
ncbi:MAG: hypothetical protein WAW87_07160, partial [Candidatus Ferrigenium altingense]